MSRLNISHPHLRVVQGNAPDREAVLYAIAGDDAVVSCLGAKQGGRPSAVLTEMARNLIAGMNQHSVRRMLYMASAGIYGELSGIGGRLTMVLLRNVFLDHRRVAGVLAESGLGWTVARPLRLENASLTGRYRIALEGIPHGGRKISRADVAHFLLEALGETDYVKKSVALAY
ncbi:NAD(P)-dependent oxidoreductase [Kyrpidia spormannii]|nr:NAD(P)-binding oxidoreductase [Kyrpidia spormannii]